MEVYLARHAENRDAADGRFGDGGLSERGRAQAAALGRALAPLPLAVCHCSPLPRARETAEIALSGREVPVRIQDDLAEGEIGGLDGLTLGEGREQHPGALRLGRSVVARLAATGRTAPGGETRRDFLARAERAKRLIESELRAERSEAALVLSHGGLLNYLLQLLLESRLRDEVPFGFEYCAVVRLAWYREAPGFGPFAMLRFAPFGAPE